MDFITNYGAFQVRGGMNLLLKMIGMPGKTGMDGSQVQESFFEAGRLGEIHRYCRIRRDPDLLPVYPGRADARADRPGAATARRTTPPRIFSPSSKSRDATTRRGALMPHAHPTVSLIVIARDEEALIAQCLRSACVLRRVDRGRFLLDRSHGRDRARARRAGLSARMGRIRRAEAVCAGDGDRGMGAAARRRRAGHARPWASKSGACCNRRRPPTATGFAACSTISATTSRVRFTATTRCACSGAIAVISAGATRTTRS